MGWCKIRYVDKESNNNNSIQYRFLKKSTHISNIIHKNPTKIIYDNNLIGWITFTKKPKILNKNCNITKKKL
jgi:hypothetical protein